MSYEPLLRSINNSKYERAILSPSANISEKTIADVVNIYRNIPPIERGYLGPRDFYDNATYRLVEYDGEIPVAFIECCKVGVNAYLNLGVIPDKRGKGLVTKLYNNLIDLVKNDKDIIRLIWFTYSSNKHSADVARHLGFTKYMDSWKELKLYKEIKSTIIRSHETKAINLLDSSNDIFIGTDWHLFQFDKVGKKVYRNPLADKYIDKQTNMVGPNDTFIFLGDMVSGEFRDHKTLKKDLVKLTGKKIFVRGNNDLFVDDFYLDCGFDIVIFYTLEYGELVFSHDAIDNNTGKINIHGHFHESVRYQDVKENKHIRVYNKMNDCHVLRLSDIIEMYKKYQKPNVADMITTEEFLDYKIIT